MWTFRILHTIFTLLNNILWCDLTSCFQIRNNSSSKRFVKCLNMYFFLFLSFFHYLLLRTIFLLLYQSKRCTHYVLYIISNDLNPFVSFIIYLLINGNKKSHGHKRLTGNKHIINLKTVVFLFILWEFFFGFILKRNCYKRKFIQILLYNKLVPSVCLYVCMYKCMYVCMLFPHSAKAIGLNFKIWMA